MVAHRRRRTHGLGIDPAAPVGGRHFAAGGVDSGAERCQPQRALDLGGYRPRAIALIVGDIVERRAAQTASRREKRDRLDTIGLAGAVWADQYDHVTARFQARRAIIAEMSEGKAVDAGGGHGISTVIAGLARRRNELPQLLTSSSAKADDPVLRAAQDVMHAGDCRIPAFAGMTAVRACWPGGAFLACKK